MRPRFTHVTLGIADLGVAVEFYERGLGLALKRRSTDLVFFDLDGLTLALYRRDLLAGATGIATAAESSFRDVLLSLNVESRAAVDHWIRKAAGCGGEVTRAASQTDWGGYAGFIADPDGHLWELVWNPKLEPST